MRGKSGFTLLELIIVVVIIGVLAAIALPRITTGIASARSSRAAHTIANYATFVRLCQNAGITEANIVTAVTAGTTPAGVEITPPLTGVNSDGMWTYTYQTPANTITATKNAAPQATNTIIYDLNTNAWTGNYTPRPTSD